MKLSVEPKYRSEISSRDIRAITTRLAHPDDPLAEWSVEFEEWRKAYAEFAKLEEERIVLPDAPSAIALRQHRYLLFMLMARGEQLALALLESPEVKKAECTKLLGQLDAFLGSLRDSWHTWHGEALPEHRAVLAKFLS